MPIEQKKRTIVYVDGFNFYYRCLKKSKFKWLNIEALFDNLLKINDVIEIKYYTANVSSVIDPNAPVRQSVYLDALSTLKKVKIIKGNFLVSEKFMRIASVGDGKPNFRPVSEECAIRPDPEVVKVIKFQEKRSDVNLASHLVFDASRGAFDVAVLVSNDTDFIEPMRIVKDEFGLITGWISLGGEPSDSLRAVATFTKRIRSKHLRDAQFPDPLITEGGKLIRPSSW